MYFMNMKAVFQSNAHGHHSQGPVWQRFIRIAVIIASAVLCSIIMSWTGISRSFASYTSFCVEMMMKVSESSRAILYYDIGRGFNEHDTVIRPARGDGQYHLYRFPLPHTLIYQIRFDPVMCDGSVWIKNLRIRDIGNCRGVHSESHLSLEPLFKIENVSVTDGCMEIKPCPGTRDPALLVVTKYPFNAYPPARGFSRVITAIAVEHGGRLLAQAVIVGLILFILVEFRRARYIVFSRGVRFGMICMASILILSMAVASRFNAHPDEKFHVFTAQYYLDHWLPPAVDAPLLEPFMHTIYGISYLFSPHLVYFLAAKIAGISLCHQSELVYLLRFLNAGLFILMAFSVAVRPDRDPVYALCLMLTPQLWYIFSYFNGDAFPFFLAFMIVLQLENRKSTFGKFIYSDKTFHNWPGGVLVGVLIGFLLLSKMSYYVFAGFVGIYALWRIAVTSAEGRSIAVRKWIIVGVTILLTAGPIFVYDTVINDFNKFEKIQDIRNIHAEDGFKPVQRASASANPRFSLISRGVKFADLFKLYRWHVYTFRSLTGVYGHMWVDGPTVYYFCQMIFWLLLGSAGGYVLLRHVTLRTIPIAIAGVCFVFAVVLLAAIYSWVYVFQSQGRYLFPAIPVFLLTWRSVMGQARSRLMPVFCLCAFILSVYSFLFIGLSQIPK